MQVRNSTRSMKAIRGTPWLPVKPPVAIMDVVEDPGGFTITQRVTVTEDVRADYETAVRMLEETRYQPAIALLLDVTEQAPTVTAAHTNRSDPNTCRFPSPKGNSAWTWTKRIAPTAIPM